MITLEEITENIGGRTLFEDVNVSFTPHNRYGLTGPNGSGKSTLLKIITGEYTPTRGKVSLPPKFGFLKQNMHDFENFVARDVVIMGNARLWDALKERDSLYEQEINDEIGIRLGDLEGIIADEDGYSAEANAESLLSGIGVPEKYFTLPMNSIPNDMQFRVLLCQSLFGNPHALLLDEPTNHLDLESINWLEGFLKNYKGTLIVVSHDRYFLNSVTTHIADIDYETLIIYPGNYDDMVVAKTAVRSRAEQDAKSKQKKIAQLQEFVSRFGAGTRASQVQSRVREMEKLQPQELKQSNIQRPYIRFIPSEKPPGKIVLTCNHISKSYDHHKVIDRFSCEIHRGDKIGVIGNNGLGKSTLLKILAQVLPCDSGVCELGHNVLLSYFPQLHETVVDKSQNINCFDFLKERKKNVYDQEVRSALGKMLFSGDDAFKKISTLSGGETARLIIAGMMLSEHNVLIMDEPNNHLDLEAVSALGWGLEEYKGTCIVASHDRDLLNRFAKKIFAFTDKGIEIYDGTLEEYLRSKG